MADKSNGVAGEPTLAVSGTIRPASDVVARRLGDSAVLVRLTTNRIYELNATGARVWELVQRGLTRDGMVDHLAGEFDVAAPALDRDVEELLLMLQVEGLAVQG
jgi:hypothetical protein